MPGRSTGRKMSVEKEGELRMRTLSILADSDEALTIYEIKSRDFILAPITTQKMARVIGHLIEMGLVRKAKSKSLGRMVYKAVSKMVEQGYDLEEENDADI